MELLQAGVDRSVIALWLGHESIEITQIYLDAHLVLKQQALAKTARRTPHRGSLPARRSSARVPQGAIGTSDYAEHVLAALFRGHTITWFRSAMTWHSLGRGIVAKRVWRRSRPQRVRQANGSGGGAERDFDIVEQERFLPQRDEDVRLVGRIRTAALKVPLEPGSGGLVQGDEPALAEFRAPDHGASGVRGCPYSC
jgi:hypothetical protein